MVNRKVMGFTLHAGRSKARDIGDLEYEEKPPGKINEARALSQERANDAIGDKRKCILICPTGWGKTRVSQRHAYRALRDHRHMKCLVTIPQTMIATGYLRSTLKIEGELVEWVVSEDNDLCGESTSRRRAELKEFLLSPRGENSINSSICVCTHALLAMVHAEMTDDERAVAFEDKIVIVDEGHHSRAASADEGEDEDEYYNGLAKALFELCQAKRSMLLLPTATFIRNDRHGIVPLRFLSEFVSYEIPYDEYLSEMVDHLETFSNFFVYYPGSYASAIVELLREKSEDGKFYKTIVYLPPQGWGIATGDKNKDVCDILNSLGASKTNFDPKTGVHTLPDGRRLMNLVIGHKGVDVIHDGVKFDETMRLRQKAFLAKAGEGDQSYINEIPSAIDVILTIGMACEGFDWHHVERLVQVGVRSSLGQMLQIIGRLFRDVYGRPAVQNMLLLPEASADTEDHKDRANEYLNAIYMCMILEDIFDPIEPGPPRDDSPDGYGKRKHALVELMAKYPSIGLEDLMLETDAIVFSSRADGKHGRALYNAVIEELTAVLGAKGVSTALSDKVAKKLWIMRVRCEIPPQDERVKSNAIDVISGYDPIAGMMAVMSKVAGGSISILSSLRRAIAAREGYCNLEKFEAAVVEYVVNDQTTYDYVRTNKPWLRLPPNPSLEYPGKFLNWDEFRKLGHAKAVREASKIAKGGIFATGSHRKGKRLSPEAKLPEIKYKDYAREMTKSGRQVPSFEEWAAKKGIK